MKHVRRKSSNSIARALWMRHTTIIHGIGLDAAGRELLCSTGAGLIWCPTSNIFLFGKTFSSRDISRFSEGRDRK